MLKIVQQRSKEYRMDKAGFQSEVSISKSMTKDGKKYARNKCVVYQENNLDGKLHCYMSSGDDSKEVTQSDVDEFLATEYDSFDAWKENLFSMYHLTFDPDPSNWMNSNCNCPGFASSFMCKHIVCVAYQLEILNQPKDDQLESNTKRGRPKNASKGLSRD